MNKYIYIYIFLRRINTPHQKPTCQNTRTNMPTSWDQHEMSKKACRQCWSVGPSENYLRHVGPWHEKNNFSKIQQMAGPTF